MSVQIKQGVSGNVVYQVSDGANAGCMSWMGTLVAQSIEKGSTDMYLFQQNGGNLAEVPIPYTGAYGNNIAKLPMFDSSRTKLAKVRVMVFGNSGVTNSMDVILVKNGVSDGDTTYSFGVQGSLITFPLNNAASDVDIYSANINEQIASDNNYSIMLRNNNETAFNTTGSAYIVLTIWFGTN